MSCSVYIYQGYAIDLKTVVDIHNKIATSTGHSQVSVSDEDMVQDFIDSVLEYVNRWCDLTVVENNGPEKGFIIGYEIVGAELQKYDHDGFSFEVSDFHEKNSYTDYLENLGLTFDSEPKIFVRYCN